MGVLDNFQCGQSWVLARSVLGYGRCRSGLELLGWSLQGSAPSALPNMLSRTKGRNELRVPWGRGQGRVGLLHCTCGAE